jgi:hypothetical protein
MAQTIAPATASRIKWFAVATMAVKIIVGYDRPAITITIRFHEDGRRPLTGMVATVRPTRRE